MAFRRRALRAGGSESEFDAQRSSWMGAVVRSRFLLALAVLAPVILALQPANTGPLSAGESAPVIAGDLTPVNIPKRWSATFRLPSLCLPRKARATAAARTLRSDQLSHDAGEPPRGDSPCGFGSTPYRHS